MERNVVNEEFSVRAQANAHVVEQRVEELKELSSGPDYHQFWSYTKTVVATFKERSPLFREDRERLWSKYEGLCQAVKKEMARQDEMSKENASKIKEELESLRYNHLTSDSPSLTPFTGVPIYYAREFWEHAKKISEMFKSSRLLKEDRNQLWSTFQDLCEEVRRQQKERLAESEKNRELISSLIDQAYWHGIEPKDKEALDEARTMQTENLKRIRESALTKEHRDALRDQWKETNEKMHWGAHSLRESNFLYAEQEAKRCLEEAQYGDPYQAIEDIKGLQSSLRGQYMDKDQREKLREIIDMAWEKATSRIGATKEEKKHRREEWQGKQEDHIQRWEDNIQKSKDYISSLESQIEKLQDQADNARTDEFADKVRGWIGEKEEKIEEVRRQIQELEDKISSVKSKLG